MVGDLLSLRYSRDLKVLISKSFYKCSWSNSTVAFVSKTGWSHQNKNFCWSLFMNNNADIIATQ